jgi:catechol 2,3-dioxygenase
MGIPKTVLKPAFNVTRASHLVLTVTDLAASRHFYVDLLGFVVSDENSERIYLRGLEEACHHSLVLEQGSRAEVQRIGFRVLTEEDLDLAEAHFRQAGLSPSWVASPHQGRTLRIQDVTGVPVEFCATMDTRPRLILQLSKFHGACPQRLDHWQVLTPDVPRALDFYMGMGFRLSEYVTMAGDEPAFVFLQRKGNPHDIVFGPGPQLALHHFAFMVPEVHHLMHICDLLAEQGYGKGVEWGPCRHFAPGYARFVYLRDPDGHRIEMFNTHYQTIDIEDEPIRWELATLMDMGWGMPPPATWMSEASSFRF